MTHVDDRAKYVGTRLLSPLMSPQGFGSLVCFWGMRSGIRDHPNPNSFFNLSILGSVKSVDFQSCFFPSLLKIRVG